MDIAIDRRGFVAGALGVAVGAVASSSKAAEEAPAPGKREYYELRIMRMNRGPALKRIEEYYQNGLVPACRRLGTGPVGVFSVAVGSDSPSFYVLIPHPSAESACTLADRLGADPDYRKAAAALRQAGPADPPYANLESRLMVAAEFMPTLEVPAGAAKQEPRIFELRTYRSPSKMAARKKLEMFGPGGELAIFKRTGLQTVFFSETLYGPHMPSLCYLLVFSDAATREKSWATFVADPEWKKLSTTPGYTDAEIVADIHNVILRPTGYSQI
jgi:NIPSNAP